MAGNAPQGTRQIIQPQAGGGQANFDVVDETGVAWRNRAAEARRKLERAEQRLEAERTAREELEAQLSQANWQPNGQQPGQQVQPGGQQAYPGWGQPGGHQQGGAYAPAGAGAGQQWAAQPGSNPVLTPQAVEGVVTAVLHKQRNEAEYRDEMDRLGKVWPNYEDEAEQERLCTFLRREGYRDDEIERFGPRDVRFAFGRMRAEEKLSQRRPTRPQEISLDTADGISEQPDSTEFTLERMEQLTPEQLDEEINRVMRAPRDYGE